MNELALFAGAGGGVLGSTLLGWRTVCAVECDVYRACVLAQRQNDGLLAPFPIWSDVTSFDGRPWRGIVDVVSGGFPCQDIAAASWSRTGVDGERSGLWREMDRIIREVRPRLVFVENSPMLTARGLDDVLGCLAAGGFDAEWAVLSAADLGAAHVRERIWILAAANARAPTEPRDVADADDPLQLQQAAWAQSISDAAGHDEQGQLDAGAGAPERSQPRERATGFRPRGGWPEWPAEPDVGRVADGVAFRVDRIEALGDGQVPRVAAAAFTALLERLQTRGAWR